MPVFFLSLGFLTRLLIERAAQWKVCFTDVIRTNVEIPFNANKLCFSSTSLALQRHQLVKVKARVSSNPSCQRSSC